ncbi:MAG: aminopeptidase [Deltaproteobacteria bacterium]|nr:aminopeptidase [Deltaproteobacteria bacterium]
MLKERDLERYADVLLWGLMTSRRERFRKKDLILIQYEHAALRLAEILYDRIITAGMNPIQRMGLTVDMERSFYGKADGRQLVFQAPGEKEFLGNLHGRIYLHAPDSLTHLKQVDPARICKVMIARKPLRDILEKREREGLHGWTLCTLPTPELAAQARTTPQLYAEQIIRACYLDRRDPVAKWTSIRQEATDIKQWLGGMKVEFFHCDSDNCDLKVALGEQRKWVGISGHNIPSFELFFSPDWRGTQGTYYANLPSYRSGNYVEGVRLNFSRGVAVGIHAESGEAFTVKQLRMDRGASRIGEFSLTDKRFSRIDRFMADTLFDENFGGEHGNCHIAVGASYTDSYTGDTTALTGAHKRRLGFNDSALHWDLVNTEKKVVTAHLKTGKRIVIYENGRFRH